MKKIIIVFIILFNFIFAQNSTLQNINTNVASLDKEFFNAEKLFFQKKYNLSREAFLLYLKKRPLSTNDMLYYYIGACYFQDKQYQNAIDYYKLAFDINDSYSYCNNIANSYYQLKNYNEALIWYNRSAERLFSLYFVNIEEDILDDYTIWQNVITNTIFIGNFESDLNTNSNSSEDLIENEDYYLEEDFDYYNENSEELPEENLNENLSDSDLNKTNEKKYIYNSFSALPLFTNIIITNTFTNEYYFTNKTVTFIDNPDFNLEIIGDITNIITTTDLTIDGTNFVYTNAIVSFDSYNTAALYYSAYLNMGHTYLALGDLTNAAISYEIFLTNVGDDYYQKDSLDRVIDLIRSNDTSIKFIPFTNNYRISENNDGSITTENISPNFDYTRETVFENDIRIIYERGKFEKIKMYSNDYEISDIIYPYGKREIEIIFENGDKKIENYFADNSKSINYKTADGKIYEYILYPDGSFINRKTENDNIITEIKKTDGSLIVKTENIEDGSYKIVANYIDGSIGTTTVDSDGISNLKIVYPDGRVEERSAKSSGEGSLSYNVKADDGSVITKTYNDDGSFTVITKKVDGTIITDTVAEETISEIKMPNGTLIRRIIWRDGSQETTTLNKDSSSITEVVEADSSSITTTVKADGSTITVTKDVQGNTETVNVYADGGTSTTQNYIDGRTIISESRADGTTIDIENDGKNKILKAIDSEGYILEMRQYRNEDAEITLFNSYGDKVDFETAKIVIRRMDLSVRAEDIKNLISENEADGSEEENSFYSEEEDLDTVEDDTINE